MKGQPRADGALPAEMTGAQEWARGWPVVFAGVVGYAAASIHLKSIGVFMKPLIAEFGWSRAEISASISITSLAGVITAPLVGRLVDRFGARKVGSIGLPLYCLGVGAAGLTGPSIWTWYLVWGLVAVVYFSAGTLIWSLGVASRFNKQRGLALAVCFSGVALAQSIVPPATVYVLEHFGWRNAYFILAGVALVAGMTTTRLFFFDAKALAQRAGTAAAAVAASPAAAALTGWSPAQALRSTIFWRLGLLVGAVGLAQGFTAVHTQAILTDQGFSMLRAAAYTAIYGPALFVGRMASGYLLDRFHGRYVAAADMAVVAASIFLLSSFAGQPMQAVAMFILLGLGSGAELDALAYMTSRFFGLKSFGVIFGFLIAVNALANGLGPLVGGMVYDALGTYHPMLFALGIALALGALVMLTFPAYPSPEELAARERVG